MTDYELMIIIEVCGAIALAWWLVWECGGAGVSVIKLSPMQCAYICSKMGQCERVADSLISLGLYSRDERGALIDLTRVLKWTIEEDQAIDTRGMIPAHKHVIADCVYNSTYHTRVTINVNTGSLSAAVNDLQYKLKLNGIDWSIKPYN